MRSVSFLRYAHLWRLLLLQISCVKYFSTVSLNMDKNQNDPTEQALNLTLEIILLLTGEDYFFVRKPRGKAKNNCRQVAEGTWRELKYIHPPLPQSVIHEPNYKKKILDLTNKMIELLTGEVPIRCQDVGVYFSMEEWDYVEEHRETYKDIMMEDIQPLTSLGVFKDDTNEYPSKKIKVELHDRNGTNPNIYTPTDNIHHDPPTPIREELVSCDGRNLTESTQHDPFNHVKEKPVKYIGGTLTYQNISTSTSTKEQPSSCSGRNFKDHKNTPNSHTQYLFTHNGTKADIQGETVTNLTNYTQQCLSHDSKEPASCSGGNHLLNTQHQSANGDEGPSLPEIQTRTNNICVQYSCSECKKCFLSMDELVAHQGIHLAEKLLQTGTMAVVTFPAEPPVKHNLLTCTKCGRAFYTKSSLAVHMKIHWGKKNEMFKCILCEKCFPCTSKLQLHMRRHFGNRPYACSTCGERFMRTCDLCKHQRIHQTGTKNVPLSL
ncbi:gastrula zinc finger protein XlCGF66.1-like isoform X2 [Dendrobates tinctorius]|uniref:gastrula zinc finger protein XlCGF66.1-like isoform X2 n=1 Tax=Dendrobates tinctorius TaxID=92724 RepID=UPI003CC9B800